MRWRISHSRISGSSSVLVRDAPAVTFVTRAARERMLVLNARRRTTTCATELPRQLPHTIPSRAMMADALAQYLDLKALETLVSRDWTQCRRPVVGGSFPERGEEIRGRDTSEKSGRSSPAMRGGYGTCELQTEIPPSRKARTMTCSWWRTKPNEFGDYLDGRTAGRDPVAGTHGLVAAGWSTTNEQWGATQLQIRFMKLAGRRMTPVDYAAWVAVRAIGEATIRAATTEPEKIVAYMRGSDFLLSGFKGPAKASENGTDRCVSLS